MPMYRDGNGAQFVKEAAAGETDLTKRLQVMFNSPTATVHGHWEAFCTTHHLDKLDVECIEVLGLPEFIVEHLDSWDNEQKELVRAAVQAAVATGAPIAFRWELTDGNDAVDIRNGTITFLANREKMLAELRGHRSAVVY